MVYERHLTEINVRRSSKEHSWGSERVLGHEVYLEVEAYVSHAPIQHLDEYFYLAYAWDILTLLLLARNLISMGVWLAKLSVN